MSSLEIARLSVARHGGDHRPPSGESEPAARAAGSTAFLAALVLFVFAMSVHSLAAASVAYWQFLQLPAGDTVAVTDLNDLETISYAGFGDSFPGGASATTGPTDNPNDRVFFRGYGFSGNAFAGVEVDDINDAGDALGSAIRLDGVRVPTIWIGGVPFDLTDPANAGLHFNSDPGPKFAQNFDLFSLPIVGLPSTLTPDDLLHDGVLTNSRQDYIFHYFGGQLDNYGLLIAVVPEPGTLVLVLAGVAAILSLARGRRHRRSGRPYWI